MFPIINSSTGCLYNSILQQSLCAGVMAPGDSSRAFGWEVGEPMETKCDVNATGTRVHTHRATHS